MQDSAPRAEHRLPSRGSVSAAPDTVTLLNLAESVLRHRRIIILLVAICTAVGGCLALVIRPVFQADMLIQLDDGASLSTASGLFGDMATMFEDKSTPAAETQIIGSRLVLMRAMDKLRLHIEVVPGRWPRLARLQEGWFPRTEDAVGIEIFDVPAEHEEQAWLLTVISDRAWKLEGPGLDRPVQGDVGVDYSVPLEQGEAHVRISRLPAQPGAEFTVIRHSRLKTVARIRDGLDVQERVKQSGVLVATLRGHNPQRTSQLLREIGEQYIRQSVERKSEEAAQSLLFLDKQLPALKRQLEVAQERYTSMTVAHGIVDLTEEARLALRSVSDVKTQRLLLAQKREELATRFTREHVAIVAVDRQIEVLRQQEIALGRVVRGLPDLQRQVAQLTLDVRVATDLYTALLASAQQLELVKAGRVANARMVDMAVVPEDPIAPNRGLVLAVAMLAGVLAGLTVAMMKDWLAGGVTEPGEVERALGVNVLGVIPHSDCERRLARKNEGPSPRLLAITAPTDAAIESLRSLHTALRLSRQLQKQHVLLVTGGDPGAGKSFVASNLAVVLAATGLRVILLDADRRCGVLHQHFQLSMVPGVADAMANAGDFGTCVHRGVVPNLDVMCRGTSQPDDANLFEDIQPEALIAALRSAYDIVLVDAPPVLVNADAVLMARHADHVLLVARAGCSRLGDLDESCKRLRMCRAPVAGVILNGVTPQLGRYGSRYGGYQYGAELPRRRFAERLAALRNMSFRRAR